MSLWRHICQGRWEHSQQFVSLINNFSSLDWRHMGLHLHSCPRASQLKGVYLPTELRVWLLISQPASLFPATLLAASPLHCCSLYPRYRYSWSWSQLIFRPQVSLSFRDQHPKEFPRFPVTSACLVPLIAPLANWYLISPYKHIYLMSDFSR